MKLKHKFFYSLILLPFFSFAQNFDFKTELKTVNDNWQQIDLNSKVLSKVQSDFSDIRIYEVGVSKDTLEVPYIIKSLENRFTEKGINFKLLNQVTKDNDLYLTFQTINDIEINEIELILNEENYNYNLDLEGSLNQTEWFDLLKDYRILSIKNKNTDYRFSKISFPLSNFKYYRVKVKNAKKTSLKSASIKQKTIIPGEFETYKNSFTQEQKDKNTIVTINLNERIPINECILNFASEVDFYRPISIKYLVDSTKTEKGWFYKYATISNSYLSSLEKNSFPFGTIFTSKIQIEISNNDNQALVLKNIEIKGPKYKLIARFSNKNAKSFMLFGNADIPSPQYDMIHFEDKIPSKLNVLEIGEIINLKQPITESTFLNNKLWLWLILILIIALLAYFSLDMLKKKK